MKTGEIKQFWDQRGALTPIEFSKIIPFVPVRTFVVQHTKDGINHENNIRGRHAHKRCQQLFICIRGSVLMLLDDGKETNNFPLRDGQYVFIDKMIWNEYTGTADDNIFLVFCSTPYDTTEYINSMEEFIQLTSNK